MEDIINRLYDAVGYDSPYPPVREHQADATKGLLLDAVDEIIRLRELVKHTESV